MVADGVERFIGTPLASRAFVRDMAIFAEHIVMNDVHENFFAFGSDSLASRGSGSGEQLPTAAARSVSRGLRCREAAPWWAPDKVGELSQLPPSQASRCGVRLRRAAWAVGFARRWSPEVLDWIDTGVGTEKAVSILRLWGADEAEPTIAVAFRGSKGAQDYYKTDANPFLVPLPTAAAGGGSGGASPRAGSDRGRSGSSPGGRVADSGGVNGSAGGGDAPPPRSGSGASSDGGSPSPPLYPPTAWVDESAARFMPLLTHDPRPCATLGAWRAYAGDSPTRGASDASPRQRVRRALETALRQFPRSRVVITGHSLGGGLAAVCAYDLLCCSLPLRYAVERSGAPLCLVTFAGPRMFNKAFFDQLALMEETDLLRALRVVVGADMIPRLAPRWLGGWPPCRAKLTLDTPTEAPAAANGGVGRPAAGAAAGGIPEGGPAPALAGWPLFVWWWREWLGLRTAAAASRACGLGAPEDPRHHARTGLTGGGGGGGPEVVGLVSGGVSGGKGWVRLRAWFRAGECAARADSTHMAFDDSDLHDQNEWRIPPGDVHACHALYLAGECSAAASLAEPHEAPSAKEHAWHTTEWPLSAMGTDTGGGEQGRACAVQ